jgi:hypothetical protein
LEKIVSKNELQVQPAEPANKAVADLIEDLIFAAAEAAHEDSKQAEWDARHAAKLALLAAISQPQQSTPVPCPTCGETEPFTGTCGAAKNDKLALCRQQSTPVQIPNFQITEDHIELLATMLHFVPSNERQLQTDLNAFTHDARTAVARM